MTHVAITGASSGIGEALAREYLNHGAAVTLVARRKEELDRIARSAPGKSYVHAADLSDLAHCADWLAPAQAALGPVDVLINNAGVQVVGPTSGMDLNRLDALLRVDLQAPLHLLHAVLPDMLKRNAGTIVNISSMAALAPTPGMTWYNAAKAGLAAASESLRGELLRTGVKIITVYPGPVSTPMADAAMEQIPKSVAVKALPVGTPGELARKIRHAVEDGAARLIYPAVYGVSRHIPALTRAAMDRFTPPFER